MGEGEFVASHLLRIGAVRSRNADTVAVPYPFPNYWQQLPLALTVSSAYYHSDTVFRNSVTNKVCPCAVPLLLCSLTSLTVCSQEEAELGGYWASLAGIYRQLGPRPYPQLTCYSRPCNTTVYTICKALCHRYT